MYFISKTHIPINKVTYMNMVFDIRPFKDNKHRTRLTVGKDKLNYIGDASSPEVSLIEIKTVIE